MNRLMQGAAAAIAPDQAETPSSAGLNQLIRNLRDEFDLDIAPRESNYSPARQGPTLGNAVFARIQFLYFTDKPGLDQSIHEYRQELNNRRGRSSAQSRTQLLHEQLNDPAWFSKERLQATPRSKRFTPLTSYTTPSSTQQPQITRFDSGASQNDTEPDSMPASPSSRKFKGGIDIKPGNHAQQQMQEASSDYGSSWDHHGFDFEQPMRASKLDFSKALDHPDGTATPKARTAKRRKLNNHMTEHLTDLAEEAQANAVGEQMMPGCHWKIPKMVGEGFGSRYEYEIDGYLPFARSVERARLRQDAGFDEHLANSVTSHEDVGNMLKSQGVLFHQSSPSIWDSPSQIGGDDFATSPGPLTGIISLNPKSDNHPLFQLKLYPIVGRTSSRLERHFGSDRFLKVTLPSVKKQLPVHIQSGALQSALQDWLQTPKYLLGRTWCMFNMKEHKSNSSSKQGAKVNNDHLKDTDVYFFATAGLGITPVSLADLINWHFPIKENADQPLCKAFARFALSDRETIPTVCFKRSQVRMVDDIVANTEPEDDAFEDPAFRRQPRKSWTTDEVMTDGCAMISVGAAMMIREIVGIADFPAVFQGRINGHKGLWNVSGPYETSNPDDLETWIQLRPSQRKVVLRVEDTDETQCEADRWCFGLVNWNKPASYTHIHKDFLPVLKDRGVSRETILAVIGDTVDLRIDEIREAIQDTAKFAIWSHEQHSGQEFDGEQQRRQGILPAKNFSKCQFLMNKAGYTPYTNHIVAKCAVSMIEDYLQKLRSSMSFVSIKSTFVFGIADPYGVLKPGEVHLSLSRPLVDGTSQQRFDIFAGRDVLIARDPTLLGSDMQKVHCVCHPRLAHLKDIVVMPSRGQIPLAAKLQGGDYDGDSFWVCADERLVEPFRNAPVLRQASIEELSIQQDKRRLRDIIDEEHIGTDRHVAAWFKNVVPFACRESMLGIVTNELYRLIYHYKSLWHPHVVLVADLHGSIIDAQKNGYIFGQSDWVAFRRRHKLPNVGDPKYSENLKALKPSTEGGLPKDKKTLRDVVGEGSAKEGSHILDDIVFNVINPKYRKFLDWMYKTILVPVREIRRDLDLEYPLRELEAEAAEAKQTGRDFPIDVGKEVKALLKNIEPVVGRYAAVWKAYHKISESKRDVNAIPGLSECIETYRAIQPTQDCFFWHIRTAETAPTKWECFKVAVLASPWQFSKRKKLLFWLALDVVQYLKSHSENGRRVIEEVQAVLKPKRPKQPKNLLVRDASSSFGSFSTVDDDDGETTNDEDDYGADGLEWELLKSFGPS
jgi:hypothetical protein